MIRRRPLALRRPFDRRREDDCRSSLTHSSHRRRVPSAEEQLY